MGIRKDLLEQTIKRESSLANMDEKARNDFFQERLSAMKKDKGVPHINSMQRISSAADIPFGRSIQSGFKRFPEDVKTTGKETVQALGKIDTLRAFSAFPPKTKKKTKKELEEEKKQAEEEAARLALIPKVMTNCEALSKATSWMDSLAVKRKNAVGTLATASHFEQAQNFREVHKEIEPKSAILPLAQYAGHSPGKDDDRFDRRIVPQLSDISFEADSEDDFEDVKNIQRQPMTVLTEENLKKILSKETTKLNLEHAYWLKDNFMNKLGRLAPNLQTLSLRRVAISDEAFQSLFKGPNGQHLH